MNFSENFFRFGQKTIFLRNFWKPENPSRGRAADHKIDMLRIVT